MAHFGVAEKMALLSMHPLLANLRDWDLDRLAVHARVDHRPAGARIFSKDDPGNSMLIVITGYILVYCTSEEGREVIFDIIGPEEICGEIAFLDNEFRSADARALQDTDYLVLEHHHFIPFLKSSPEACLEIIKVLCERLRATIGRVEDLAFLDLHQRLAKKLLAFAENFGEAEDNGAVRIDLPLSQSELGAMVNAGRESVNRQLHRWINDGLIAVEQGQVWILDRERLEGEIDAI